MPVKDSKPSDPSMKPPRAYARGILHFFGGIRRSTLLRSLSFGGSALRIHPWAYPAFVAAGYYGGVGRPWSSAEADKEQEQTRPLFDFPRKILSLPLLDAKRLLWKDTLLSSLSAVLDLQSISLWIKIPYTLFVVVLVPVYWVRYGPTNLLWFSDIALIGTLAALWLESRFLVSMMTTGVLMFDVVWSFLFFYELTQGGRTGGIVGYMFDSQISIFIRALSLFHIMLPIIQLWAVSKLGYDIQAWKYQVVLGWIVLPLTYAVSGPEENINWVFGVKEAPQKWLPATLYVAVLMVLYPILVCFPTHRILKTFFAVTR